MALRTTRLLSPVLGPFGGIWPTAGALPLRVLAMIVLLAVIGKSPRVLAYDVCADNYDDRGIASCAHEQMFDEAMRLYSALAPDNRFSQDIIDHAAVIREGVGDPDEADPLYDNTGVGDSLITITHFWQPDSSFGFPQVQVLDPYPNAFNASQALWLRALGEYAAGNKSGAYRFLGMIAHFLGDQTVPAHANGDTHPEMFGDGDPFEEWMSNPLLNKTLLTDAEYNELLGQGLIELPDYEFVDQLLWLFLNVNQVADYFASDDDEGDAVVPSDPRYPYANDYAVESINNVITACGGLCPTSSAQLQDNDNNDYPYYYDFDDDLDLIRRFSYVTGVRKLAALFSLFEEAIRTPILTLTVHRMEETGYTDAIACLGGTIGLDGCDAPDFYLGVVMGSRGNPIPPGALLESDNDSHSYRVLDGQLVPAALTRTDANNSIAEDKTVVEHDYHFGQAFKPNPGSGEFVSGVDVVDMLFQVKDQDLTIAFSSPYGDDEIALIHPNGLSQVLLQIDLDACVNRTSVGINVIDFRFAACAASTADSADTILVGGGRGGEDDYGEDSADVDVRFSVTVFVPDTEPPVITCDAADGIWYADDVGVACTAVDEGSGLANPADASFTLWTNVPSGTETSNALTGTREICDAVGNCATAGPVGGNRVDKKAPVITIVEPMATEYAHSATLILDYSVVDGGSGVSSVTPTMDGDATVGGNGLSSGQAILLLTSLPLGEHTFEVDAEDNVENASPTASVTFSIVVTPESLIEAIAIFEGLGDIRSQLVRPLLATLQSAAQKFNEGECGTAANIYRAFINQIEAQTGKGITPLAAEILITDAEYLIANC